MKHFVRQLQKEVSQFILLLLTIIIFQACMPVSKQLTVTPIEPKIIDESNAVKRLSGALRFKTTLDQQAKPKTTEFLKLHKYLKHNFPAVHEQLNREVVNELSLLYKWQGSDPTLKPVLFLSHLDVVPVDDEKKWSHPPFNGVVADGDIWGRGALDVKFGVTGILEAVEFLIGKGFQPRRTMYLAFGHDEELMGTRGGERIAKLLASRNVELSFILDEGMPITQGIIPDIDKPIALIGTAAKGQIYLKLIAEGQGGHGSIPPKETPISILSKAITKIYDNPFQSKLTKPLKDSFEYLAPEMPFFQKLALSNLWLFEWPVRKQFEKSPKTNAAVRTVVAANIFKSGDKDATVPTHAEAVIAIGILPGETVEGTIEKIKNTINDPRVKLSFIRFPDNNREHVYPPTPTSPTDYWGFKRIQETIHEVFPDTIVAPTLYIGGSDGKHYINNHLTDKVYYFWPLLLSNDLIDSIHGTNERLPISKYLNAIQFYIRFIENVNKPLSE